MVRIRRLVDVVAAAAIIVVVAPTASVGVVLAAFLFLPLPAELPARTPPAPSQLSRVLDAAGNEIATFRQFETSIPVAPQDIPDVLEDAVVAVEDRRFFDHDGVDPRGVLRALWSTLREREVREGGSTITQQLVKNTVTGADRTIVRKVREAVLAAQLERQMSKEEILFEYLSVIYLGEGAYGVGAAAETYFRKPVSELTLSESALLAGLIPAPSRFNPRANAELAEQRRLLVLREMLEAGMIPQTEHDAAAAERLWFAADGAPPGPATVVHPPLGQHSTQPYFTAYVFSWLEDNLPGGVDQVLRGGLTITTTLDPVMQYIAATEVGRFLEGTEPDLQTSLVAIEPPTGFVRAFVSGRDFAASQVNYALGAAGGGSGRQPGSAFKPFVLAAAFEQKIGPDARYSGALHRVGPHTVSNYSGASYGTMTLRAASWDSVNTAFSRLILDVGVAETMSLARRLGLESLGEFDPAVHGASVALGTEATSPLEMASAYGVFAARGQRAAPVPVLQVLDRAGDVLIDNTRPPTAAVIAPEVADNVNDVLSGVLEHGTAAGRGIDRPAAGKTGTTQNHRDAWFVGYTPTLSTAVWMGYENRTAETARNLLGIRGVARVTGGSHPAQIWQRFMRAALAEVPVTGFNEPAPIRPPLDEATREARRGFSPPAPMRPERMPPPGSFVAPPEPPRVTPPPTTVPAARGPGTGSAPGPGSAPTTHTTPTTTPPGPPGPLRPEPEPEGG